MLIDAGCEVRGDEAVRAADARAKAATEEDWPTEYLDAIIAAKVVDGVDGAIAHIERYGSHHTDAIVTERRRARPRNSSTEVDSAIVLHNASTQFADGGEFGFGAEIGIATGKHACARPGRRRAAHLVQVSRARLGTDPAVSEQPQRTLVKSVTKPRVSLPPHAARHADRIVRRLVQSAA